MPRAPETTAGRHIFVAVASSDRVPAALSFTCIRTRRISSTYSPYYRTVSSTQTPEHLRRSPERRRASSSPSTHSSKAAPPAPTSPLAPPRSRAANRPPLIDHPPPEHPCRRAPPRAATLSAVDRPPPTISRRPTSTRGCGSISSSFPPTSPSPPVSLDAGKGRPPSFPVPHPTRDLSARI